jgi:hypothetical protein
VINIVFPQQRGRSLPKPHPPASRWRMGRPPGTSVLSTHTHHLLPVHPKSSFNHSVSGFGPNPPPPPGLTLVNAQSPHLPPCHPPTPSTSRHRSTLPFRTVLSCSKKVITSRISGPEKYRRVVLVVRWGAFSPIVGI